jgi:NADH-quinone oxidoreductase subunit L
LNKREPDNFSLRMYYGHVYEYPVLGLVFFISSLGIMGFPITLSFIGEDLIFSHIKANQFALAFFYSISFVFGGIAAIRVFSRLFLGPHCKPTHETSLKSS